MLQRRFVGCATLHRRTGVRKHAWHFVRERTTVRTEAVHTLVLSLHSLEVADEAVSIAYAVRTLERRARDVDVSDAILVVFLARQFEPVSYAWLSVGVVSRLA